MSIKLVSLKNRDLPIDGDWVEVPDLPGVRLRVRSMRDPRYRAALAGASQRFAVAGQVTIKDVLRGDKEDGMLAAEYLLTGWEGFDIAYDAEAARAVLTDPDYSDLRRHVFWAAGQVGQTQVEFVETAAKNSESGSTGN